MSLTKSKDVGGIAAGFLLMLIFLATPIILITGAAKFSVWALDWIPGILGIATLVCMVLAPLAIIPATRRIAAALFGFASLVFGACLWLYALAFTYLEWGMVGVIIGVFIFGVGVVFTCALAAIFSGTWIVLGNLAFLLALFMAARFLSVWLAHLADQQAQRREMRDSPSKVIINQDSERT